MLLQRTVEDKAPQRWVRCLSKRTIHLCSEGWRQGKVSYLESMSRGKRRKMGSQMWKGEREPWGYPGLKAPNTNIPKGASGVKFMIFSTEY
jgi:hypothetical protein